jgi:hypothetical protein
MLSDSLRHDPALVRMGTLDHLVEAELASRCKVTGELPSLSWSICKTAHAGLTAGDHAINADDLPGDTPPEVQAPGRPDHGNRLGSPSP